MSNKAFNQLIRKLTKNSKQGSLTYWDIEENEEFIHVFNKYGSDSVLGTGAIAGDKSTRSLLPWDLQYNGAGGLGGEQTINKSKIICYMHNGDRLRRTVQGMENN